MSTLDTDSERTAKVVWTVTINRPLAERVVKNLPRDDYDLAPKKGSRSHLIEGLLKTWVDQMEANTKMTSRTAAFLYGAVSAIIFNIALYAFVDPPIAFFITTGILLGLAITLVENDNRR